jgi:hypothetical protein
MATLTDYTLQATGNAIGWADLSGLCGQNLWSTGSCTIRITEPTEQVNASKPDDARRNELLLLT